METSDYIEIHVDEQVIETKVEQVITQEVIVSYYTASENECGKSDGITASGQMAIEGVTVAADHLPLGTLIILDGKTYVVQDRFGGGYTDKIDVFVRDRQTAISRGIERKTIIIYDKN